MGTKHKVHPKLVGDQCEAMVIARLIQAGKMVYLAFGENHRYDILVDEGDHLVRIQCKSGRLRNGAVCFNPCSVTNHHPNNQGTKAYRHTYKGQAELFVVYCVADDSVYLVPVDHVGSNEAKLRVEPTRNGQSKRIRWARDYELRPPG